MKRYTVKELAKLAGVSIRTLHYYDEIGLLRPALRSDSGYRLYGEKELLRLQQILFYRELDVPLDEIRRIISNPHFSKIRALQSHKKQLQKEIDRLQSLQQTIDKTLLHLKGVKDMLSDKELYEGFTDEQAEKYSREARQKYGNEIVEQSEQRIRKMSKEQWTSVRNEHEIIAQDLSKVADKDPSDPAVQAIIKRHHEWIEIFYPAPGSLYRGLGLMYTQDPRFRQNYDKYLPGLADFMKQAIDHFCETFLD